MYCRVVIIEAQVNKVDTFLKLVEQWNILIWSVNT